MKKYIIALLFNLLFILNCFSQEEGERYVEKTEFLSPQVASFIRYDQMPVALNTGRLDLTIPVMHINDPDFDFPITLNYNSGGYKPTEPEGMVGLNWSLGFGGTIYREVRTIADNISQDPFYFITYPSKPYTYSGFLKVKEFGLDKTFKENAYNNTDDYLKYYLLAGYFPGGYRQILDSDVEPSSDLYTFNFCGYSGQFMIDFDGNAIAVSHSGKGKVHVDLSHYGLSHDGLSGITFVITTDNGYKYTFGGDLNAVEYTALSWTDYSNNAQNPPHKTISAFHLTQIEAPNGRILSINYADYLTAWDHRDPRRVINNLSNVSQNIHKNYLLRGSAYSTYRRLPEDTNQSKDDYSFSLNKIALISSIETDKEKIFFYHSSPKKTMFFAEDESQCSIFGKLCGVQIDSILRYETTTMSNPPLERSTFSYEFDTRLFLKKVTNSTVGSYDFFYNRIVADGPFTRAIDHWGFWNGRYENLMPKILAGGEMSADRDPGEECDIALLNKIIYPTGGMAKFEYEPHIINDSEQEKLGGGARIASISHYEYETMEKPSLCKYYSYNSKQTGKTSGWLNQPKPVYYLYGYVKNGYEKDDKGNLVLQFSQIPGIKYPLANSNGFNISNNYPYHLRYDEVTEYNNPTVWQEEATDNELLINKAIAPLETAQSLVIPSIRIENDSIEWTISGRQDPSNSGRILIYKDNIYSEIAVFDMGPNSVNYVINPYTEWGEGTYFVVLIGGGGASVAFEAKKANIPSWRKVKSYSGSYITTFFTSAREIGGTGYTKVIEFPIELGEEDITSNMPFLNWAVKQRHFVYPNEGGKISNKRFYSGEGNLIKEEIYDYSAPANKDEHYALDVHIPPTTDYRAGPFYTWSSFTQLTKFPLYPHNLVNKTIHHYTSKGVITEEETYNYDHEGYYVKTVTAQNSDGVKRTEYLHGYEMTEEPYIHLKNQHVLSPIVQITNYQDNQKLSTIKKNYSILNNTFLNSIYPARLPVVSSVEASNDNYPLEVRGENLRFDQYGNVLYQIEDESKHTVYIWSYQGLCPIAKIENATYDQVENALNRKIDSISLLRIPLEVIESINALRTTLTDASVTTYTYYPFVGLASVTDPAGLSVYYEYDKANRLIQVYQNRNGKKEILESHQYNLVNP
ncbi:hypothetical protein M2451_004078 [Dysgonomonas sp. PFB1-18]|uniref:hypothetical protein n=1 Tax=unclassified Dysgonomonas TaxID=2630389 RepID=UPI002475C22F|nr:MULTISPECIES: hypothetical protein [unclassified Dysgonomonas]MDH6310485.1 hypothetical protein [Dysgonomonas sp. PF1-14]MDH6340923.1 hypothetical protein [Dysgonomonas sp. PF1-16]MDH6382729.1 hypothetical protein [Dysgonomonas sp. PFB1-18]MDH6399882.1 hypothetical protein [Dysgonomonas sp. PF1-23]